MRIPAVVAAALLVGALAGCSGETQAKPLPPLPSATPSVAAAPTPPPEALAETPQGASAFTRFFFEQVNRAYADRDPAGLLALSAPQCNSCKSVAADIDRLANGDLRVGGRRFVLAFAEAAPASSDGSIIVDFRFDADPYVEMDARDVVVRSLPAKQEQEGQARLVRGDGGWLMSGLRLVED